MKIILIIFILVVSASTSLSQIIFDDFAIGDSIKKYNGKIYCSQGGPGLRRISDDSCIAFKFLTAKEKPINIKEVLFSEVAFIIDSSKIITSVHLFKFYLTTDSLNTRKQSHADYEKVRSYLENLTSSKGEVTKSSWDKSKLRFITERIWKSGQYMYRLNRTEFKKRTSRQKVLSEVSLVIEREDN